MSHHIYISSIEGPLRAIALVNYRPFANSNRRGNAALSNLLEFQ